MSYSDDLINHKVLLERQKNRIFMETVKQINNLTPEIVLAVEDNKTLTTTITEIKKEIDIAYEKLNSDVYTQLKNIAAYETDFQYAILLNTIATGDKGKIDKVSRELLYKAIFKEPLEGLSFAQNFKILSDNLKRETERAVRISVLNGESIAETRQRITQRINVANNQYNSFIRTATQNVVHKATQMTYDENKEFIKKIQYVAILDSRTTDICKALDGNIYDVDEGPRPPQHWNCRSFTIPIFTDDDIIDKSYGDWVDTQSDKTLNKSEKGRFVPDNKTITIQEQREIEEKRLDRKI